MSASAQQLLEQQTRIRELEARVRELEDGLSKARDTFEDMERAHRLLNRPMLARSAALAKQAAAVLLAPPGHKETALEILEQMIEEAKAHL